MQAFDTTAAPPLSHANPLTPSTPAQAPSPSDGDDPPLPPDWTSPQGPWLALDRPGAIQAIGGLILGLIALFSSYDHLTIAGRDLPIPQQWGIPLIAASVATVFIDAELASRSRLRAAQDAARAADETARERDSADRSRKRQARELALLRRSALLSARVQLDPSALNQERLRIFLRLMEGQVLAEEEGS